MDYNKLSKKIVRDLRHQNKTLFFNDTSIIFDGRVYIIRDTYNNIIKNFKNIIDVFSYININDNYTIN